MRIRLWLLLAMALTGPALPAAAVERLALTASDGVAVTADVYPAANPAAPWIVLAHMAGSSRGEYREIAPRLNRLGYGAIALDQRSGGSFAGVRNETAAAARALGRRTDFLDAVPDIEAGVAYARSRTRAAVLLWGSSYSASLALVLAGGRQARPDGVIAMSPGEYLPGRSVAAAAAQITVPVLIVSPRDEAGQWRHILDAVPHDRKAGFTPARGGRHGSSALIPSQSPDSETHWQAVEAFLARHFAP